MSSLKEVYMSTREFFVQLPYLCGAMNAARCSRRNALIWDDESNDKESVFARNEEDLLEPFNRISLAYDFIGDMDTMDYCTDLGELILLSYYQNKYNENHSKRIEELWASLSESEMEYPEVQKIMSVQQAMLGIWED
jgi:hypothetical protein